MPTTEPPRSSHPSVSSLPGGAPLAAPPAIDHVAAMRQAFRQVFPGVMVAMFLASADQTILASALPTIASHLGGLEDISWVVVAYLVAATVAAPLYGHLGDQFGRKRMLLVALTVFTIASLACAVAPTLITLILARALQGLGGGGLMTLAQSLIGENVPPRERGRFQGYFAGVFALASTSGPILGAYLTEQLSWRAIFAVNLPLGLIAFALAMRIPYAAPTRAAKYRPDVLGVLMFCASTVGLLYVLSSAGHRLPFTGGALYAWLAVVCAAFVVLYAWERRLEHPVIPVRLIARAEIARSDIVVMCFAAALFSTVLYLPLYLQIGRGLGISTSGTLLLPITLSMVAAATTTGRLVSRTGEVVIFPIAGLSLATLALLTLAATISFVSTALALLLTALVGIGLGMVMPATQIAVQHAAGRESLGAAIGSLSLSRSVGGAIGVAIIGAVVFASLAHVGGTAAATMQRVMQSGPEYLQQLTDAERSAIARELDQTFRTVFLCIAAITGIGALVARTVPKPRF